MENAGKWIENLSNHSRSEWENSSVFCATDTSLYRVASSRLHAHLFASMRDSSLEETPLPPFCPPFPRGQELSGSIVITSSRRWYFLLVFIRYWFIFETFARVLWTIVSNNSPPNENIEDRFLNINIAFYREANVIRGDRKGRMERAIERGGNLFEKRESGGPRESRTCAARKRGSTVRTKGNGKSLLKMGSSLIRRSQGEMVVPASTARNSRLASYQVTNNTPLEFRHVPPLPANRTSTKKVLTPPACPSTRTIIASIPLYVFYLILFVSPVYRCQYRWESNAGNGQQENRKVKMGKYKSGAGNSKE